MGWIDDVQPQTTIRSVWGNAIRNQIHQIFTDLAEANSHLSSLADGATATIGGLFYLKVSGAWRLQRTWHVWASAPGNGTNTGNIAKTAITWAIPAGFATVGVTCEMTFSASVATNVYCRAYNGANVGMGSRNGSILQPNTWLTVPFTTVTAPNAAGETLRVEYSTDYPNIVSMAEGHGWALCLAY